MSAPLPRCPVCGEELSDFPLWACTRCRVPHHPECWEFTGGCSVFGCGEVRGTLLEEVDPATLPDLVVTEHTAPQLLRQEFLESLQRRIRSRLFLVPRTVTAGMSGAVLSIGLLALASSPFLAKVPIWGGALIAGVLHGLLAPYLAPLQVRRPRLLTTVSMFAFLTGFAILKDTVSASSLLAIPGLALVLTLTTLFATSLGEWVAGWRSPLALESPGKARKLRLLSSWAAFTAGVYMMAMIDMPRMPDLFFLFHASLLGVLGVTSAVAALETGKSALLAREDSSALVPSESPPAIPRLPWTLAAGGFGAIALATNLDPGHSLTVALTGLLLGLSGGAAAQLRSRKPAALATLAAGALGGMILLAPWLWAGPVSLLTSIPLAILTTILILGASGAAELLLPPGRSHLGARARSLRQALLTWFLTGSGLIVVLNATQGGVQSFQALTLLAWALPALAAIPLTATEAHPELPEAPEDDL